MESDESGGNEIQFVSIKCPNCGNATFTFDRTLLAGSKVMFTCSHCGADTHISRDAKANRIEINTVT